MSSKYFATSPNSQYKSRSCPLNSLDPTIIKTSIDKADLSKEENNKFTHNSYLNSVSKALGYKGWDEYVKAYETKILPFLNDKGLSHYVDDEKSILKSQCINFTLRQISDRLFLSKKPLPKAIFTGYSCNIDYSHWYFRSNPNDHPNQYLHLLQPLLENSTYKDILIKNNLDALIPMTSSTFIAIHNLIGDVFVQNNDLNKNEYVFQEYDSNKGLVEQKQYFEIQHYFHQMLLQLKKGWIEIIPFSEHLIFLKAQDGSYDFVFKNLRISKYYSPFGDYIKHDFIPTAFKENYDFERWQYFGFKGDESKCKQISLWQEKDEHESEIEFYTHDEFSNYPSTREIMKSFYIKKGLYPPIKHEIKTKKLDGFNEVVIGNKTLFVSQLITIQEFLTFYKEYEKERSASLDNLETVNIEDTTLPISVTWYDAIAYCKWLENKNKVQMRLITPEEYKLICPKADYSKDTNDKSHFIYGTEVMNELKFTIDGHEFNPQESVVKDFETNVIMQWKNPLKYIEMNNLRFCINSTFKEWSFERGITLSALYPDAEINHETKWMYYFAPHLNNKYKYIKTGFRVCYEVLGGAQ